MTTIMSNVEPPKQAKAIMGLCPHCSEPVDSFLIDAESRDDVVITLRPCGCISYRSDHRSSQFIELLKSWGSLY